MTIHIELDQPHGYSYFAGDILSGRVIVRESRELMPFKEIQILLVGRETIKPADMKPITSKIIKEIQILKPCHHPCPYESDNVFAEGYYLSQETFTFPFRFDLPYNLPSSFETPQGQVFYQLEGKMKPIFREDHHIILPFTVNGILDLNWEPEAQQTQECLKIRKSNLFVGRRGKICLWLELPLKSGFVPGEPLQFQAYVKNHSNRNVLGMTASLLQVIFYNYAYGSTEPRLEVIEEILNPVHGPEVGKRQKVVWKPTELVIPDLPPTGLGMNCGLRLIDVRYVLQFQMEIAGLTRPIFAKLPVLIGNVPLAGATTSDFPNFLPVALPRIPIPTVTVSDDDEPSAPVLETETESNEEESGEIYMNPPNYEDVAGARASPVPFLSDCYNQLMPTAPPPSYAEALIIEDDNLEQD